MTAAGRPGRQPRTGGISWSWPDASRGFLCAFPAAALAVWDLSAGICFALGTLPVALLGVPGPRRERPRLMLVGLLFATAYALGCVVGQWPVVAVAALAAFAYEGIMLTARHPAARLLGLLVVPAFALGMNEPVPSGFALAALFAAGGAWATVVALLWTVPATPSAAARPPQGATPDRQALQRYAIGFTAAATLGLALGFGLDLAHPAWAAAAAMFIMRPDAHLLASRAAGRVAATFAGVLLSALLVRRGLGEVALVAIAVSAVAAIVATRASRWYVSSAGTGLVVLLMSGVSSADEFKLAFADRLLETTIGAVLAIGFGIAGPAALRSLTAIRRV